MLYHLENYLQLYFSRDSFRCGQREVIEAILQGRDVFALWPTGAGKSLTYQLPALLLPHLTIIVSPLIALMEDQVNQLRSRGLNRSACLTSQQSPEERESILNGVKSGQIKMLFLAPERLTSSFFLQELRNMPVSLLAVDEAHCITQWGHDFRPHYLYLGKVINTLKPRSILAVTATASEEAMRQIINNLGLNRPFVSRLSLDRPNLFYKALQLPILERPRMALAHLKRQGGLPAVVYVGKRRQAEDLAQIFRQNGLKALPYHAGLDPEDRRRNLLQFLNDEAEVITATIAFGMGVDKPNIRQVIHMHPPLTPEGYYQESGRAGRDRENSSCLLMWSHEDFHLLDMQLADKYPDESDVDSFYELLERCAPQALRPYFARLSSNAWSMLLQAALGEDADFGTLCVPQLEAGELKAYFAVLRQRGRNRLNLMKNYCQTEECRRRVLLNSFDQPAPAVCQGCDSCAHRQRVRCAAGAESKLFSLPRLNFASPHPAVCF